MGRSKGEGSVFQRANGMWVGRIELPSHDGGRRRKEISAKKKSDLLARMAEEKRKLMDHGDLPTASLRVDAWLTYWMDNIAVKTRRPKTVGTYKSNIEWIKRSIGTVRLDKLTPTHVRKVHRFMEESGKSPTYIRNTHSVMSAAFRDAQLEGRIAKSPTTAMPAPLRGVPELAVLTPTESKELIAAFHGSPDAYLWVTYMLTGARRGEVIGLEWDRVGDTLDLSWQLQRLGTDAPLPANYEKRLIRGGLHWTRPKSRAGWREVPLVDPLRGILERWREIAPPNEWGLVFTREWEGQQIPIDPDWVSRQWPRVLKEAGITKPVRLHDLRHGAVDLLYEAGVPEDLIQEIVGHSTRAMSREYKSRGNRARMTDAMHRLSSSLGYEQLER